jgi:site-specific recombinase XerD
MTEEKMRGVFERPRGSGVWWISYCDGAGARHREKIGRRSVAVEAYIGRKRELREGRYVPPSRSTKVTFHQLADRAIENKETHLSRDTVRNDKVRIGRLEKLGKVAAIDVTAAMVEKTLRDLQAADDVTGSTVNRYRSFISSVFRYGVRRGIVLVNPCAAVARYKESEHRIRFLDAVEEDALRVAILASDFPEREASVLLAMNTGMRLGEQLTLTWECVALDRGVLTVRGKTGRRFIPVNAAARQALEKLYAFSNGAAMVSPGWSHKWFTNCVKKSGVLNFRWHDLRHTFASRLVMAGVDIRTVQELMGHASIEMTMRYAHLSPDHTQAAVNRLDGAMPTSNVQLGAAKPVAPEVALERIVREATSDARKRIGTSSGTASGTAEIPEVIN